MPDLYINAIDQALQAVSACQDAEERIRVLNAVFFSDPKLTERQAVGDLGLSFNTVRTFTSDLVNDVIRRMDFRE